MSVVLHISRNIHHMIFIYGAHEWNDDISRHFLHFFKILTFWVVRRVKQQKIIQNKKKFCLSQSISQEPYIIMFIYGTQVKNNNISRHLFHFFQNFDFLGYWEGQRAKNGQKWQKNSIPCALYLRNHIS